MNTLESYTIESPWGVTEDCAKFVIDDTLSQFLLSNIATIGQKYTLTLWVKADSAGRMYAAAKSFDVSTQWKKQVVTFTAEQKTVMFLFQTVGTYYIYHPQLEVGNKSTDWTAAPEDVDQSITGVLTEANNAIGIVNERVAVAESLIQQLSNCISMLVVDENGTSLMTQTEDGWTFSMQETNAAMSNLSSLLQDLQRITESTKGTVDTLNQAVTDHGTTLEYVHITEYEDEPCIFLGESDSDFKLLITNTRIMFMNGSNIPTYINTNGLVTRNIEVKGEIIQGGYVQLNTPDGGWGVLWKGVIG